MGLGAFTAPKMGRHSTLSSPMGLKSGGWGLGSGVPDGSGVWGLGSPMGLKSGVWGPRWVWGLGSGVPDGSEVWGLGSPMGLKSEVWGPRWVLGLGSGVSDGSEVWGLGSSKDGLGSECLAHTICADVSGISKVQDSRQSHRKCGAAARLARRVAIWSNEAILTGHPDCVWGAASAIEHVLRREANERHEEEHKIQRRGFPSEASEQESVFGGVSERGDRAASGGAGADFHAVAVVAQQFAEQRQQ